MPGSDFQLTAAEFDRIRELVREHTGISLSEAKRQLVYGRLSRRLRALKMSGFAEYIELLERGEPAELEEFTNAVTTNLTSFFREPHHFEYLARELLPRLVANAASTRRLRIWCCAASTGEEPYSIAMVLREAQQMLYGLGREAAGHGSRFGGARHRKRRHLRRGAFREHGPGAALEVLRRVGRGPRGADTARARSCAASSLTSS